MKFFKIEVVFIIQAAALVLCLKLPVTEKALNIASSTYALNLVTSIVWGDKDLEEVNSFIESYRGTVVLTPMQNNRTENIIKLNKRVGYKQTVLFVTDVSEFTFFITVLKPVTVVPINLILVLLYQATEAEISVVTKTALENDLADIIVVSSNDTQNVELSTYFPYSKEICGNSAPVRINANGKKWFPKKYSSFLGCPIRVTLLSLIPYSWLTIENNTVKAVTGIDGNVFTLLMEKLNASMNIVSWINHVDVIGTIINGTATDSFGELVYGHADILVPGIMINYLRYQVAQISHICLTVDIYWFGPHRQEIQEYLRVLQPLINDITPFIFTSFVLFVMVVKIVIRFDIHKIHFEHSVTFQSFIIFLGQGVKFQSKSRLVNFLFVMWIWCCLIVRIAYQGDLIKGFQKTVLEEPFKDLKEAVKAVEGYGGSIAFREFYRGTSYFKDYNVIEIGDIAQQLKKISQGKKLLIATDRLAAFETGYSLQIINEPISHAPMCYFMRPGWPAAKEIDGVIQRLAEVGFVQKSLNDYIHEWLKKKHHVSRQTHPLNMKTLIGCFYGLWISYVICTLIFFIEIFYHKLTYKPKNIRFYS